LPAFEQRSHRGAALGIEIVGRLVQQQQVRPLDHEPRQRHTRAFAAAERGHRPIERQCGQGRIGQRELYARFQRPVGDCGIVERAFAALKPPQAIESVGDAERLGNREALICRLRERTDRARAVNRSTERVGVAGDHTEQ
jgi:hypothetical protein